MIYRPSPGPNLWDTWLFHDGERYHLFHLVRQGLSPVKGCDGVGHAVSDDLVHWTPRDTIQTLGATGEWDASRTHTGMVIRHEARYVMFYGTTQDGVQRVGMMTSDDLDRWEKHPANPVMAPARPHYQSAAGDISEADWRDPFVFRAPEEECYETVICGRKAGWGRGMGACIGRARTKDLVEWELLPPIAAEDRFYHMEVPEYFELNGRHYLTFSSMSGCGARLSTPSRERLAGTFYMIADERTGPYRLPEECLLLGSGEGRFDNYVGRITEWEGRKLLYHHNCGPRPAFGAPKVIEQAADGTLSLRYWPGLEELETDVVREGFDDSIESITARSLAEWPVKGNALQADARPMNAGALLPEVVSDAHITCRITPNGCTRAALLFRFDAEAKKGCMVSLDYETGRVELGAATLTNQKAIRLQPMDKVQVDLPRAAATLRVLARAEFVDCYLNDRCFFSAVLHDLPQAGRVGVALAGGEATLDRLRVAALEPLA